MALQKNVTQLKNEVLAICGELQNGQSPYDAKAVYYLNKAYESVVAGGNIFGTEVSENWVWAQARRPIPLALLPPVVTTATLTQGSNAGVFSAAPSVSLQGTFLRVDSRADIYIIASHIAGSANFTLDQAYQSDTGLLNVRCFYLDYNVKDDTIIIDASNQWIDFQDAGSVLSAQIPIGTYDVTSIQAAIIAAMVTAGGVATYTMSFDPIARIFKISSSGTAFGILFGSGPHALYSMAAELGMDTTDYKGALAYSGTYAKSAILRFAQPITVYRESPTYWSSAKDVCKVFMIDRNTYVREFPLARLYEGVPDKFCGVHETPNGLWTIRFNSSVQEGFNPIRAEVDYIPPSRMLIDNANCFPNIPGNYTEFLIDAAAFYLLSDKNDSKAQQYFQLSQNILKAMVNDNRRNLSGAGVNFGKLLPRRGQVRIWGYFRT